MKVVILAGGLGTRLSEETSLRPKPMIEIGGMPILWHIMKIYEAYGYNEFIICLGYKGYMVKEYFANYILHQSDVTINLIDNSIEVQKKHSEPWKVTLVDTGINTMTGGRIKRVAHYIGNEPFLLTYGDGVGNIAIDKLVNHHLLHGKLCTVTAVQPSGRFGALDLNEANEVVSFLEKPKGDGAWINGGFFVCQPDVIHHISDDSTIWERGPMEYLASINQLSAYKHDQYWKPMDTLRDKTELEKDWNSQKAQWKIWS